MLSWTGPSLAAAYNLIFLFSSRDHQLEPRLIRMLVKHLSELILLFFCARDQKIIE